MKRRALLILLSIFVVLTVAVSQTHKVEIPKLSTEPDEFGARPGTFHFVTNEQTMANMAELQKTYAALESLEVTASKLDPAARLKMASDLKQLRAFVDQVHAQSQGNAGKMAGEVEERLNAAKGKAHCGACHGHGMGRMMHGRQ